MTAGAIPRTLTTAITGAYRRLYHSPHREKRWVIVTGCELRTTWPPPGVDPTAVAALRDLSRTIST
jgi:hypothetical protein